MSDLETKAAELFAAGESVNAVAKALGIAWNTAKQLQGGAATKPAAGSKRGRRKVVDAAPESDEVPESFDLGLTVESAKLDRLFAAFTMQEKANAVAGVIQARMDVLLEG